MSTCKILKYIDKAQGLVATFKKYNNDTKSNKNELKKAW